MTRFDDLDTLCERLNAIEWALPVCEPEDDHIDYCFDDYCGALERLEWLTVGQYACLLKEDLAYGEEHLYETRDQYQSECALFGDAGPGQGLAIRDISRRLQETRDRLDRLHRIIDNLTA